MEQLDNFAWDNSTESIDFFGEVENNPNLTKTEDGETKLKDLEDSSKKEEKKKEEKSEEEIDAFKDLEEEKKEDSEEEEDNDDESEKSSEDKKKTNNKDVKLDNIGVVSYLKEKGFLDFELEEGKELDEETASTMLEDKFEESIENKVNELIKELPETVKNLVKYAANGGDVNAFINGLKSKPTEITKDLDLDDEKNQELVVRMKLEAQGEDADDIETQIEFLKEKGKLADIAEKHFEKVLKETEEKEAELVEKQKLARKKAKEDQIKFKKEISDLLDEKEEINNLKFTNKDKKDLPEYISSPSIELQDGRVITPFYNDLFETLKDKEKTLLLAKLIKSGFDFSDIEKFIKTKQATEVKENLRRTDKTSVSKGSSQPKRITDYFD